MTTRKLGSLLSATRELSSLQAEAQRATKLQQIYLSCVPTELAEASRIAGTRGGTVCIVTESPVTAAKIKQLVPRLLTAIQKCDGEVTVLQVRVQPAAGNLRRNEKSLKRPLTPDSIEYFRALSTTVGDGSPLKIALTNLVRRHGGGV
jgi:hypothetical protein